MPGLCGSISLNPTSPLPDFERALGELTYGRATLVEQYADDRLKMGCAHLGTGGQRALYASPHAAVLLWGYLTRPAIPPGADGADPPAAAHYVHDQYLARGKALLDDLQGAFAFALWDKRAHTLLLAVDRLGMRPLYYTEHAGVLRFACEVKALLTDPALPRRLDRVAAAEFFHFRYVLGERTFFEDIRLLPPASYLEWQDGRWQIAQYWQVVYPERFPKRPDRWYEEQIYEALRAAVERMVRPDLTYGLSLSSGMDSRWIAALLGQLRPDTQAFTFGAPDSGSVRLARRVAEITGLQHHCWELSPGFMAEHAERMVYISDGMHSFVDAQEFPLITRIGDHVDVAVGGFMGSGFFGENPIYVYLRARDVYPLRVRRSRAWLPPRPALERLFDRYPELEEAALSELRAGVDAAPARRGFQIFNDEATRQRQRRFTFYAQLLKTPYVDMVHPIADNEIWELSLQLPPGQLAFKWALRRTLGTYFPALAALPWNAPTGTALDPVALLFARDVWGRTAGQWLKRLRRAHQPAPRSIDYPNWLRGALRPFVEATLLDPAVNATGLFDPHGLRQLVQAHMEGRQDATLFLGLALPFALWTRMFYTPATPVRPAILPPAPAAEERGSA